MAIAESDARQPYLDHLEMPKSVMTSGDYQIPGHHEIDPDDIEFIIDVDLDELTVFFGDKRRPYLTDEVSDHHSVLVDAETDRVIGVILHRFLSEAVKIQTSLVPVLRYATIIAGPSVQESSVGTTKIRSVRQGVKARLEDWLGARIRHEEQKEIFSSFARLIGIH